MPKLRLKDLRLNQVPFYYQTYDGTVDEVDEDGNLTGESIPKYSNPVRVLARVSPNSGNAEDSPFGKDIVYDKTISTVQKLYCSPCLKEQVLSNFLGIRYILQFRQICLRLKKGLIIQSEIPREKIKFIWLKNRLPMQYHLDFQLIIQAEV